MSPATKGRGGESGTGVWGTCFDYWASARQSGTDGSWRGPEQRATAGVDRVHVVETAVRGGRRRGRQADPGERRNVHDSGRDAPGVRIPADGVGGIPAGNLDVSESAGGTGTRQGHAFAGGGGAVEGRRFDPAGAGGDGYHRGGTGKGLSARGWRLRSQGHESHRCAAAGGCAAGAVAGNGGGCAGAAHRMREHREPAGGRAIGRRISKTAGGT